MFKLFATEKVDTFARSLASDLARRFPPASEARTDTGAVHQIQVILDGLGARAARFRNEERLGIYGKAKLGNTFRWQLQELGFSKVFADRSTKHIITMMAMNSDATAARK